MATRPMEVGDLEVGLLRTFLAVVDFGSLGKTAVAIDKTQSAVSQQMLHLEKIVGQKLFARGRNGITLTHHGELLIAYANRAVDLNEEILVRFRSETAGGRVVLGMSTGLAMAGLVPAMKRFQAIHRNVELRVVVGAPARLEALLTRGELHLVISEPAAMRRTPAAKCRVPLEWAGQNDLNLDPSQAVPLVLFEGPCSWQEDMLASLREAGREWRVTFESASLDAILAAAQSGLGIAALPADLIRRFRLVRVKCANLPPAPKIEFGLFRANALPRGAQTLLDVALALTFKPDAEDSGK